MLTKLYSGIVTPLLTILIAFYLPSQVRRLL